MKPSKFIRPNECLTTSENYGVYMQAILLRDPLIYVDYTSMPYKVYRHKNFFEKLVDKIGNR